MSIDSTIVAQVVSYLEQHPEAIHEDTFKGLKSWCEKHGHAKFSASKKSNNNTSGNTNKPHADPFDINPEEDPDPERWPTDAAEEYAEVAATKNSEDEAQQDQANEWKSQAAEHASNGNFNEAIKLMTKALNIKPESAMFWANRADLYAKQKFAKSALKDANKALEINSESARALRVKGIALRHLGKWEEAADALNHANQVDYDEGSVSVAKMCTERANKIRQTRWRKEQEKRDQEELDRLRAQARAKAAAQQQQRAQEEEDEQGEEEDSAADEAPPRGGGGFPGMAGGMPGGIPPQFADLMNDPELQEALQDPEVSQKLAGLMSNPMAALQYMGDPKVGPIIQKLMGKMMGGGGMPGMGGGGMPGMGGGGMPGGFPGMPGMGGMGGGGMPKMPGGGMGGMFGGGGKGPAPAPKPAAKPAPAPQRGGDDLD